MKQITAGQHARIHPYLPVQRRNARIPNIIFINGILHLMENGCKWRALPERFGNWFTVCARFRRWSQSGVLERLFATLREQHVNSEEVGCFSLDSTSSQGASRRHRGAEHRQTARWMEHENPYGLGK